MRCYNWLFIWSTLILVAAGTTPASAARRVQSLDGRWQFRREVDGASWKTATVPQSFEAHEGIDFDGVGIYRRQLPQFDPPEGRRILIHIQAAATFTEVSLDGQVVGSHQGGWTPFRMDVTDVLRANAARQRHELQVRVDEKVGHNTQGFLPVIAPHFGGLWQSARLVTVPACWIDDLRMLAIGDPAAGQLRLDVPLRGELPDPLPAISIRYRLAGAQVWSRATTFRIVRAGSGPDAAPLVRLPEGGQHVALRVPVSDWRFWSPAEPVLYDVEICLHAANDSENRAQDRVVARAAFRTIEAKGTKLLLNGRPLSVRGLLNWGYAPPRVAPSVDEAHMRKELALARSHGFNLMKFCLWIPPQRYLELADEMGMLVWMEYPTWHSRWTRDQFAPLEAEYTEFFHFDRNHPSVILRSLTCETGPSADLTVIRILYDRCHRMIPGTLVEDDSSWIAWNRIHDFYDDHPYGNNHTWVATLARLKQHMAARQAKPLLLGEAIAADTWVSRDDVPAADRQPPPFWVPRFLDGNDRWLAKMKSASGALDLDQLAAESKHYALLMRKYQIEAYRREVPQGGYVVSVIRDIPLCSMGLLDYLGRPKWSPDEWQWHGGTMLLLRTEEDRRSFQGGQQLRADLLISHFGADAIEHGTLRVSIEWDDPGVKPRTIEWRQLSAPAGDCRSLATLVTDLPRVSTPTRIVIRATLACGATSWSNQWPLWVVPAPEPDLRPAVELHSSCSAKTISLFAGTRKPGSPPASAILVAERLDDALLDALQAGRHVLLFATGQKGSYPLSDEWFLRGGPFVADQPLGGSVPRRLLLELQHFDLAGPVVPDIGYLDQIDPLLMLWHNHDLDRVKTHGLLFEARVGEGHLLVTALQHTGATNSAGQWLIDALLHHLDTGPRPKQGFSEDTVRAMRAKINERRLDLTQSSWRFKPDPQNVGLRQGWQRPGTRLDDSWKPIRIGVAWEGAGYPSLDGWAWYRTKVPIPTDWQDRPLFVCFAGADDYYELFVNGAKAGSGGNIQTRSTAFDERKSHDVTRWITAGQTADIAVRVYDWYGAGGLFRPIWISTAPVSQAAEMLQ